MSLSREQLQVKIARKAEIVERHTRIAAEIVGDEPADRPARKYHQGTARHHGELKAEYGRQLKELE